MLVKMFMSACLYGMILVTSNLDIIPQENITSEEQNVIHIKANKKKVIIKKD